MELLKKFIMCPKIAYWYVGCVDVHLLAYKFFIDISLFACPRKKTLFITQI